MAGRKGNKVKVNQRPELKNENAMIEPAPVVANSIHAREVKTTGILRVNFLMVDNLKPLLDANAEYVVHANFINGERVSATDSWEVELLIIDSMESCGESIGCDKRPSPTVELASATVNSLHARNLTVQTLLVHSMYIKSFNGKSWNRNSMPKEMAPPRSFPLFRKLPIEIRLCIWTWSMVDSRTVTIHDRGGVVKFGAFDRSVPDSFYGPAEVYCHEAYASCSVPNVLHVNQESRSEAKMKYSLSFGPLLGGQPVYFDFDSDVLLLSNMDAVHAFTSPTRGPDGQAISQKESDALEEVSKNLKYLMVKMTYNGICLSWVFTRPLDRDGYTCIFDHLSTFRNLELIVFVDQFGRQIRQRFATLGNLKHVAMSALEKLKWEWNYEDEDDKDARAALMLQNPAKIPQLAMIDSIYWGSSMEAKRLKDFLGSALQEAMESAVKGEPVYRNLQYHSSEGEVVSGYMPRKHIIPRDKRRMLVETPGLKMANSGLFFCR